MHNLLKCSNNFQNIYKLYQDVRNATKDSLTNSLSYRFKICSNCKTCTAAIWEVQVALPFKFLSNFWTSLKILPSDSEINL